MMDHAIGVVPGGRNADRTAGRSSHPRIVPGNRPDDETAAIPERISNHAAMGPLAASGLHDHRPDDATDDRSGHLDYTFRVAATANGASTGSAQAGRERWKWTIRHLPS